MQRLLARLIGEDLGQDLIEYAMLAGLISVLAVAAIAALGSNVDGHYQDIQASIP